MTAKELLHQMVDRLSDDEAEAALALLHVQLGELPPDWPPSFFGMLDADPDLASQSPDILREEFGHS
jgi:hypothetical protein